jgi:hypothetical protein
LPVQIVMPRDRSFALALLGSLRRVHEPILNSLASKRMVDIFPGSLSFISGVGARLYLDKIFELLCIGRIDQVIYAKDLFIKNQ